ncbi:MAG TPA: SDR family oxidoreductase [Steroidobacteraceae bacterium]|nr:SDR family oxidoreductase [Steroidobacteraceae bacterium]
MGHNVYRESLFAGKVAYIAGGTSGINLGIALRFAELGARVAVVGRKADKADSAANEIRALKVEALGLSADVREYEAVERSMQETLNAFGGIDIVVSGAAGNFPAPAVSISAKGFKTVVDIDLIGTYNVFHAAFGVVRKPGASLIAISAPQALHPMPWQAHVCAAKAGINMLVKCLAMEWGPAGVRVNGISPGPIAGTEGMARLAPTEAIEKGVKSRIALRRFGRPDEVGDAAIYLCSPAAEFVTGTILDCDGGSQLGDASRDCLTKTR